MHTWNPNELCFGWFTPQLWDFDLSTEGSFGYIWLPDILSVYTCLGKFDHDLTVLPSPGIMVYFGEIIPFYGRKIQVSEIL